MVLPLHTVDGRNPAVFCASTVCSFSVSQSKSNLNSTSGLTSQVTERGPNQHAASPTLRSGPTTERLSDPRRRHGAREPQPSPQPREKGGESDLLEKHISLRLDIV